MLRIAYFSFFMMFTLLEISTAAFAKIRTDANNPDEQQIYEVIYRLQRGIQKQNMPMILDNYIGEEGMSTEAFSAMRQEIIDNYSAIFNTFETRLFPSPFGQMSNTRDFQLIIDKIQILIHDKTAKADISAGFAAAEVDSSYLVELSPVQLKSMSEIEVMQHLRFRPITLIFRKVDNNWNIASYGELPSLIRKMNFFYGEKFNAPSRKKK